MQLFSNKTNMISLFYFRLPKIHFMEKRNGGMSCLLYSFYFHCVKKCPYSELFWSVFSRIRTEYRDIRRDTGRIPPYSIQIRKKADQNNSKYEQLSRSVHLTSYLCFSLKIITLSLWIIDSHQQRVLLKLYSSNQELFQ